jgi:hypothetical protein
MFAEIANNTAVGEELTRFFEAATAALRRLVRLVPSERVSRSSRVLLR